MTAPLILDPTEDGRMLGKIKERVREYNNREKVDIKVVEKGGARMATCVKSNPLGEKNCWSKKCAIC